MVDFSDPNTQNRITSTGMIGSNLAPKYTPGPIDMGFINTGAGKPDPTHVNPDKALEEQRSLQEQQVAFQREQFEFNKESQRKSFELSQAQLALSQKQSKQKKGKIICTEYWRRGFMHNDVYEADQRYGIVLSILNPEFMAWYHENAPWWIAKMQGRSWRAIWFTELLWLFVKPWSDQMAFEMGALKKGSRFGKWLMKVGFWLHKRERCKL